MLSSVRIDDFLFSEQSQIYRKSLGRVQPDHNSTASGKLFSTRIFRGLEIFRLLFKTFPIFWQFSGRSSQNCLTIYIQTEISGCFG